MYCCPSLRMFAMDWFPKVHYVIICYSDRQQHVQLSAYYSESGLVAFAWMFALLYSSNEMLGRFVLLSLWTLFALHGWGWGGRRCAFTYAQRLSIPHLLRMLFLCTASVPAGRIRGVATGWKMTGCPRNDFRPNLDVSVHVSGHAILRSTLYHLDGI